jgi:hypothetical protein
MISTITMVSGTTVTATVNATANEVAASGSWCISTGD